MKKLLTSAIVAASFLLTPALAWAEGAILSSSTELPGYSFDQDSQMFTKDVDIDPDLATNISKWKMRIETRSSPGVGYTYDQDQRTYTKRTVVAHNPLTDGPNFCTHVQWSDTKLAGYTYEKDAKAWFKVSVLTIALAKQKGLR